MEANFGTFLLRHPVFVKNIIIWYIFVCDCFAKNSYGH